MSISYSLSTIYVAHLKPSFVNATLKAGKTALMDICCFRTSSNGTRPQINSIALDIMKKVTEFAFK